MSARLYLRLSAEYKRAREDSIMKDKVDKVEEVFRRKYITGCVLFFKKYYPSSYEVSKEHAKEIKGTRATPFGSDSKKEWRWELSIPTKLFDMINYGIDNPPFLKDDAEVKWFSKTFPAFTACEKF